MADHYKDIHVSVFKNFQTAFESSHDVRYPHTPVRTRASARWMEVSLLGPVSLPSRKTQKNEAYILNVLCFAKAGAEDSQGDAVSNIWGDTELADLVRDQYHQLDLSIQDWSAVGDPHLFTMRFEEVEVVNIPTPAESAGLLGIACSVTARVIAP